MAELATTDTPSVDPNVIKMLETVEAGATKLREKAMADFEAGFAAELAKRLKPNRETLERINGPTPEPERVPALSSGRIFDPRWQLYERMKRRDPEMAVYRSPDSDHWSAEWIRGMTHGNHEAVQRAADKLNELYGLSRATLVEGPTTAVSGLSQGESGFLMPLPLANAVAIQMNRSAKIRSLAKVENSVSKTLRIPTAATATAYMLAEGATATQGEPDMSSVLLDKKKQQCQFGASKETLRDSAFDLTGLFTERAGSAMGQQEDVEICTGASTPTVSSTIIAGITDVAEGSSTVLTYADLVTFWYTLPEQYQASAIWLCGGVVAGLLTRLTMVYGSGATLNGTQPVLSPANPSVTLGDGANVQGFIFGRPVVIVPLASGGLYVGDIRRAYTILDEPGIEVESSLHAGWSTDTVLWKFTRRFDGS